MSRSTRSASVDSRAEDTSALEQAAREARDRRARARDQARLAHWGRAVDEHTLAEMINEDVLGTGPIPIPNVNGAGQTPPDNNGNTGTAQNSNSRSAHSSSAAANQSNSTGATQSNSTGASQSSSTAANQSSGTARRNETPASTPVTYADIKDLIPSYGGDPAKLDQYISAADTLYIQLADDHNRKLFLLAIRTKLRDKAFEAVRNLTDVWNWRELRRLLREKIAPVTPEHAYAQLSRVRQQENESITDYTCRVEGLLALLNRASADPAPTGAREHVRSTNARLAKKSFELGLANRDIRTIVLSANHATLALAAQAAGELEATGRFSYNKRPQGKPGQVCGFCKKPNHSYDECRNRKAKETQKPAENGPEKKFCKHCRKPGHLISDCYSKKAADEKATQQKAGPSGEQQRRARKARGKKKPSQQPADEEESFTLEQLKDALEPKN